VAGSGGMVGKAVCRYSEALGDQVVAADHASLDVTNAERVLSAIRNSKPDVVINCAAWTDVDGCERDSDRAYAANSSGPENLARASRRAGCGFITISTDYVFDGSKGDFYTQRDDPNPQSVYASAKLDGERRAQLAYARTIVVRSGFIFGPGGKNFLSNVAVKLISGGNIKAISDSRGTPTYAVDLARRLRELAQLDLPGIFHVVNEGEGASYEEFARKASEIAGKSPSIEPVSEESLGRPAPRPADSRLKCLLSEPVGLSPLPDWHEALTEFLIVAGLIDGTRRA
jgi:dTDP-4-dehydrorhamnose reductase